MSSNLIYSILNLQHFHYRNAILIFDEAHNVEGQSCDSSSFEISTNDMQSAIMEVKQVVELAIQKSMLLPYFN